MALPKRVVYQVAALACCFWLSGCVAPGANDGITDVLLHDLGESMERCLENQAQTNARLQAQEQRLALQQVQLTTLADDIAGGGVAPAADAPQPIPTCPKTERSAGKLVVGELEEVWLPSLNLALPARIDTGAETASLDARDIELFERNGRRWVRFAIIDPETGDLIPLERRVNRMVQIIQSNSAEPERRAVIKMGITIGHINQTAEFTLSNRSHLDYQVLIGRNILQDVMVVDVSRKNIAPYVLPDEEQASAEGAR
ncbi:MAG: ATP-dependent zinc protease [Pseudomonadota bacterium]